MVWNQFIFLWAIGYNPSYQNIWFNFLGLVTFDRHHQKYFRSILLTPGYSWNKNDSCIDLPSWNFIALLNAGYSFHTNCNVKFFSWQDFPTWNFVEFLMVKDCITWNYEWFHSRHELSIENLINFIDAGNAWNLKFGEIASCINFPSLKIWLFSFVAGHLITWNFIKINIPWRRIVIFPKIWSNCFMHQFPLPKNFDNVPWCRIFITCWLEDDLICFDAGYSFHGMWSMI